MGIFTRTSTNGRWLKLSAAMSLACILNLASPAEAAEVTVNTDAELKAALTDPGRTDGDVIIMAPGLEMDLSGGPRLTVEQEVTIKGQAGGVIFHDAVAGLTGSLDQAIMTDGPEAALADVGSRVGALKSELEAYLPGAVLKGGPAHDGGIYFKKPSSLINLTITGFEVDATTGSTYFPHITDTDNPRVDGLGFERFENVAVVGNKIKNDDVIDGGILGTPSYNISEDGFPPTYYAPEVMKGVVVMDNEVESTGNRVIGGAMGAWGAYGTVEGSAFVNNSITAARVASGSAMAPDHINLLKDSLFYGNSSYSSGGSGRGAIYIYKNGGNSIDLMENTYFISNTATGASAYGGAISDRTINGIETIRNSVFAFNELNVLGGGSVYGGALDAGSGGTSATSATSAGGGINTIAGSLFYGNKAQAGTGSAYGGAIIMGVRSAFRDDADWRSSNLTTTISDSRFINNEVSSTSGSAFGGAIYLETNGYSTADTADLNLKTIDFIATNGGETLFSGNKANGLANSVYVGQRSGSSNFDVVFNMKPESGGRVVFDDPVTVNMNGGKSFTLNSVGQGTFYWGGANDFNADGGAYLNFKSGLNILGSDFSLTSSAGNDLFVSMASGAVVQVDLAGRDRNLALFDQVTDFSSDRASLGIGSYQIGDFSDSWLLATGSALPGRDDFNLLSGIDQVSGLATIIDLDYGASGEVWMKVSRSGTDSVFKAGGANVVAAQGKITEVFNKHLSGQERAATFTELMNSLPTLTGEAAVSQALAGQQTVRGVTARVLQYKNQAAARSAAPSGGYGDEKTYQIWGGFFGLHQEQDNHNAFSGYDADMRGGVFGLSHNFTDNFSGGLFLAVGSGDSESKRLMAKTDTKLVQFGLLGDYDFGNGFSLSGDLSYARLDNEARRKLPGGSSAEADFNQTVFGAGLEAAYAFSPWAGGKIRPFLGLRYQRLDQDGFTESGGVWAQQVKGVESDSFTSTLGADISHDFVSQGGLIISPELKAAWVHEFGDEQISGRSQYLVSPGYFKVNSLKGDEDFANVGASLTFSDLQDSGFAFKAGYEGTLGSNFTEHSYYGTLSYSW